MAASAHTLVCPLVVGVLVACIVATTCFDLASSQDCVCRQSAVGTTCEGGRFVRPPEEVLNSHLQTNHNSVQATFKLLVSLLFVLAVQVR